MRSMLQHLTFLAALLLFGAPAFAFPLINEFEPNAFGNDPVNAKFEILGTPGERLNAWVINVESDATSRAGLVHRVAEISGVFDANGTLLVFVPDFENPSFTVILTSNFTGTLNETDIDPENNGTAADLSAFGTIYDAVGIPDTGDDSMYGAQLGGVDMPYKGSEPELFFRDGYSHIPYIALYPDGSVFDVDANAYDHTDFNEDINLTTFGTVNPVRQYRDLRITEIWPGQEGADVTKEWFEIANYGSLAWEAGTNEALYFDDDSQNPAAAIKIEGITRIDPNGTAVVVIGTPGDAAAFYDTWQTVIDLNGIDVGHCAGATLGTRGDTVNVWMGNPLGSGVLIDSETYPDTSGDDAKSYDVELKAFSEVGNAAGAVASDALGGNLSDTPAIASPGVTAEGAGNVAIKTKTPNITPVIHYILF